MPILFVTHHLIGLYSMSIKSLLILDSMNLLKVMQLTYLKLSEQIFAGEMDENSTKLEEWLHAILGNGTLGSINTPQKRYVQNTK